jgi:hypothetical protein
MHVDLETVMPHDKKVQYRIRLATSNTNYSKICWIVFNGHFVITFNRRANFLNHFSFTKLTWFEEKQKKCIDLHLLWIRLSSKMDGNSQFVVKWDFFKSTDFFKGQIFYLQIVFSRLTNSELLPFPLFRIRQYK